MEFIIIAVSLVGIVLGADWLVDGAVSIAKKYKVSDFVIGAAIVGIGTSMPELTVSFSGALQGNSDVAIGNVVGSNIFNVMGILGVTALFFPIAIQKQNMKFEIPVCIALSVILTLLSFDFFTEMNKPQIAWYDGLVLLAIFVVFMWYSFRRDRKNPVQTESVHEEKPMALWKAAGLIIIGLGVLITSCDFFVDNAIVIARRWGMSEAVISITLIACGTSLPELAASVVAACKKNTQMALGNIVGSNIFNIALILGLSSQVSTLDSANITIVDYSVMIFAAILPLICGIKGQIGRISGSIMLSIFITYSIYLIN
ncbi:MAG: calcium/sodium antiporter [Bacteroidales bacterium]|nr:calcium/sodium antiporter [Bacteroidales bacterium]